MPTPDLALRVLAGTTWTPRAYTRTSMPSALELHLMNRMGCGYSRSTLSQVRAAGGAMAWFEQQLNPSSVPEAAKVAEARKDGFTRLSLETGVQPTFVAARALYARAGFQECPPFEGYWDDPNSVFMTKVLA